MANLYRKPIRIKDPKTGQKVKAWSRKWWGRLRDENGKEKRVPLATDKTAAQAMLNELIRKMERRAAGVVDRFDEDRKKPIGEHLSDFKRHLEANKVSQEQVNLVAFRCGRIVEGCKAKFIGDLSASRVQTFLANLREQGICTQTSNHYLRAIKQFTRWLVKDRRAGDDPIAHVAMLNVSIDRRHDRRPLSHAEFAAVFQAATTGLIVRRMPGPERAMLYAVAAYTGLRASELASLAPESFDLVAQPPTVTVQAAYSKHRRQDVLPLHPSLVGLLRPWLERKPAGHSVWPGNWAKGKEAGVMLKHDLKAAGIPYIDGGRFADFHALRFTFITNLVKSGVSPKAAQSLARHSTIDLTMNVYTKLTLDDQASALASLPPIAGQGRGDAAVGALGEIGTDGPKKVPTVVPRGADIGAVLPAPATLQIAPDCTKNGRESGTGELAETAINSEENGAVCARLHQPASDC